MRRNSVATSRSTFSSCCDLGEEAVYDVAQPDLVEVDPLLGDQPQEHVEGPLEDVGPDLVGHRGEATADTGREPGMVLRSRPAASPGMLRVGARTRQYH